ncbi:delta-like protein 4 [Mya arenaria]|uniref:delta-like protein 4 n=1 Tax=Mya arenaria TaxID=6604 RepID=UPI0022E1E2CD|nr:delta-like protein 4 [Mya arenaria]
MEELCSGKGQCNVETGKCVCNGDYWGEHCQYYDYCGTRERCFNGGTCRNTIDDQGFQCHCPKYTIGWFCEHTTTSSTTTTTTTTTTTSPASL